MIHARQRIRQLFVAALDGLATTGSRVYSGHPYELGAEQMPGLVVVTPAETVTLGGDLGAAKTDRVVSLEVHGFAVGATVEDTLDAMAAEVEIALADAAPEGRLAGTKMVSLVRTEMQVSGEGKVRTGEIVLVYAVAYRTACGVPTELIA